MELGLSKVAEQEGIVVTDEELGKEISEIADTTIRAQFDEPEPRMHLRHALRQTKTLEWFKEWLSTPQG
jgi:FKBP-type peptidyl-prolyl cis-trans isomerase (trigger factor)